MSRPRHCPDWLDPRGRAEWVRVVESGVADDTDDDLLAAYCLVRSIWTREGDDDALRTALTALERAIGITPAADASRRPTRIVFVDEGPSE